MAAIALQREIDAYNDALDKYRQQARHYKAQANQHDAAVDEYRASFVPDNKGEMAVFYSTRGGYYVPNTNVRLTTAQANQYNRVGFGNNQYGFQYKDKPVASPGEFTMEQPTSPGAGPSATAAQMAKLSQPSLTDIERVGDSGLINNAFKY
jgi:hypothetical protein